MAQIYKIYINEVALIITDSQPTDIQDYQVLQVSKFNFFSFYEQARELSSPKVFLLLSKNFKSHFMKIKQSMKMIRAAGGLVSNEEKRYLFIFRNGKWDLPKGKLDSGETIKEAAVREVEEECGIQINSLGEKICNTYHIYEMNHERILKKTSWYRMYAVNQKVLIPQLEEGITDVRWLAPGDFMMIRQNTYPLIRDLLNAEF
ncbi:MAG: NUDIX domain-containing protein [Daejeonella sp.]|uniref:NUDIX hydrolase n=1 Tax=Daejeonella sp. TaxID=2805397 RepID=UPI0027366F89|nr:NUDIX domain-containing protein [Daejeonella sp.]MDP3469799.1 NUDIX domain-containing protein [Daejeonella sp.]